jgi:hypothetical protein
MGDPIEIEVRGYKLSLRKGEAATIESRAPLPITRDHPMSHKPPIALLGNPNCGKTTLFNALTGANQRVGNWPGVTVDRKEGSYRYGERPSPWWTYPVSTPLMLKTTVASIDEAIARDYLLLARPRWWSISSMPPT